MRSDVRISEKDLAYARVGLAIARKDFAEADRICSQALERFETEDLLRLRALILVRAGKDHDAKVALERAVRLKYYDGYARVTLAILALEDGDFESMGPHLDVAGKVLLREPELFALRGLALIARGKFKPAATEFTRALELNPESTLAYQNRAECWTQLGRAEEALADNAKAIELYRRWGKVTREAQAYVRRGEILAKLGRLEEALLDYAAAERLAPTLAEVPLARGGFYLWRSPDLERARAELEKSTELDPKLAEAWIRLGHVRFDSQQFGEARTAYDRFIALAPKDARGYLGRGRCRVELRDLQEGLRDLDRAIELDAGDPLAWVAHARARRRQEDFAGAEQDLKEALSLDDKNVAGYMERAYLALDRGDWTALEADADRGRGLLEKSRKTRDLSWCYAFRGWARFNRGRMGEAQSDYEEALRIDPRNPDAYFYRGVSREAKDPQAAAADYERAVELSPAWTSAWFKWGNVLVRMGEYTRAESAFQKSAELDPRYAKAWMNLGVTRRRLRKFQDAVSALSNAIDLQPAWSLALANRAQARLILGETEAAREDAERAVAADANLPEAHLVRGLVRKKEGDFEGAIQDITRSLELDPAQTIVRMERGLLLAELRRDREALADLEQVLREDSRREPELRSALEGLRRRIDE